MASTVSRFELAQYLDELLDCSAVSDYGPNGLQVEGREEVGHLVVGVSACLELFEAARERAADAVLVHHGIFWDGIPPVLTGLMHSRVKALVDGEMSLFAYHLPLDRHEHLGNNAVAARRFGLAEVEPFGIHAGVAIGCRGRFPAPTSVENLKASCMSIFKQEPLVFPGGPDPFTTIGIVSGGAQKSLLEAIAQGLDAFLTGEASEWVMNQAQEAGIHYVAAGHYATERLGVMALGEHLAERFGIEVEFVDVPNPV